MQEIIVRQRRKGKIKKKNGSFSMRIQDKSCETSFIVVAFLWFISKSFRRILHIILVAAIRKAEIFFFFVDKFRLITDVLRCTLNEIVGFLFNCLWPLTNLSSRLLCKYDVYGFYLRILRFSTIFIGFFCCAYIESN